MRKSLLDKYKRRLAQEQEDLRAIMSRRGQAIRANHGEVPEDSAEQAANAYSKEFVFHQTDSERLRLSLVNQALTRIESPDFGSCESCGKNHRAEAVERGSLGTLLPGVSRTGRRAEQFVGR